MLHNSLYDKFYDHYSNSRDKFFCDLCSLLDQYCRKTLSPKDISKHITLISPKINKNGVKDYSWCFPYVNQIVDVKHSVGIADTDDDDDNNITFDIKYANKSVNINFKKPNKWIILEDIPDIYNLMKKFTTTEVAKRYAQEDHCEKQYTSVLLQISNLKYTPLENPYWSRIRLIFIGHIHPSSSSPSSSAAEIIGFDSLPYEIILIIIRYLTKASFIDYSSIKYCGNCREVLKKSPPICSKCKNIYYCNKQCQIQDWRKRHKQICC